MKSMSLIIDDIPSVHAAHQIQAVTIGFDGKLYINVGDGMVAPGSHRTTTTFGARYCA